MSSIRVDLSGHVAVITGSTSGIGLHMAEGLAANGADIVLNGLGDPDVIEKERQRIAETHGVKVRYHGANMLKADEIEDLIAYTARELGRLDILVNCAGIQHVAPIEDFPADKWDAIIGINLTSAFHTMKHAVPIMREQGRGRIVNIASAHALRASPFKAAYVSAKHGLMGLTKTVALETAEEPITANAICPGYVLTPLVEAQIPDTMEKYNMGREEVIKKVMLERQPSREFATVEQLGGTAVFLCSDAAAQITGTTISVDGGWTAL